MHFTKNFFVFLNFVFFQDVFCADNNLTKILKVNNNVFHLRQSTRQVFKKVPMWTLDSKGMTYVGYSTNDERNTICEDFQQGAVFLPNPKCPYKGGCDDLCFFGVFGNTETQQILDLHSYTTSSHTIRSKAATVKSIEKSIYPVKMLDGVPDYDVEDEDELSTSRQSRSVTILKTLYPKLVIVVDFALFQKHRYSISNIMKYMNIFWNSVDQSYMQIIEPEIKLKVVGLIIEKERNTLPFFINNTYGQTEIRLNMTRSIKTCMKLKAEDFMHLKQHKLTNFDAIITMTRFYDFKGPIRILGRSIRGSFCSNIYTSCSIIHDDGGFEGIHPAVHELGHIFGLQHDGYDRKEAEIYESCDPKYYKGLNIHTVMAPTNEHSSKRYLWSNCSKNVFKTLKTSPNTRCLGDYKE